MTFMPNSLITKSSQNWKLTFGGVLSICGFVTLVYGLRGEGNSNTNVAIGGLLLGLLSFVATWFSIRCPRCGAPWLWMAVSKQKHLQWLDWLYDQKVCPKCGHDPKPK